VEGVRRALFIIRRSFASRDHPRDPASCPSISRAADGFSPVRLIAGKEALLWILWIIDTRTHTRVCCLIFDAGLDGNGNYRDKRALARYSPGVIKGLLSFFFSSGLPGEWRLARSIEIPNLIIRYRRSFPPELANSTAFVRYSLSLCVVHKRKIFRRDWIF